MRADGLRTQVMGILNVTPDSFSDGGRWADTDAAIAHALTLVAQGADIIDVGGESTRPGSTRVPVDEEQRRVLPVIRALSDAGVTVSVDTMNAATAKAAAASGAAFINDVSGGLADPAMVATVVETDLPYILMHWRGHLTDPSAKSTYRDAAADVRDELFTRVDELMRLGVDRDRLILDPGLGFSKDPAHNWRILANLSELRDSGLPVMVGVSRKRFLGDLLPPGAPPVDRDFATAITSALAAKEGIWAVRVHDVAMTRQAIDVVEAWQGGAHG